MRRASVPENGPDILFGETPYGWRLSRNRSKLVMDDDEQRVLAIVRHMYVVGRAPMREIVSRLREMGVVSRRGRRERLVTGAGPGDPRGPLRHGIGFGLPAMKRPVKFKDHVEIKMASFFIFTRTD